MVKSGTHACAGCGCNVPQKVGKPGRARKWCPDCDPGGRYTKADAVACKSCGEIVKQPPGRGKRHQYCSDKCRKDEERRAANSYKRTCEACGKEFKGGSKTRFCGPDCRYKNRLVIKPCEQCGTSFKQHDANARFCSQSCNMLSRGPKIAEMNKQRAVQRQCLCCQKPFRKRGSGRNVGKYCSRECAFGARRLRLPCARLTKRRGTTLDAHLAIWFCSWGNDASDTLYIGESAGGHKKRCIKYGCHFESFAAWRIFERDGWRCQICECDLLPKWTNVGELETPHPRSPTIDHIVPLSFGPSGPGHRPENVQAACWSCNSKKSDSFDPAASQRLPC